MSIMVSDEKMGLITAPQISALIWIFAQMNDR